MLQWAKQQDYFLHTNGNGHNTLHKSFQHKMFVGCHRMIHSYENSFAKLDELVKHRDWIYGFFSYELKNEIEQLHSKNPISIPVPNLLFVIPETVIGITNEEIEIASMEDPAKIYNKICSTLFDDENPACKISLPKSKTSRSRYIQNVNHIKNRIVEGEFYEMNYCIEYTAQATPFDPVNTYLRLNEISPMPFSALMKFEGKYLICASPERFLKKEKTTLISQPIKGTIKRSFDQRDDEALKKELLNSEKERAENLMIVDLVRNDLAKSSIPGTVIVEELFGINTFKRIHQMISTISATFDNNLSLSDIIKNAFPMGSMTGAPKIRVMQEIDELEDSSRGLYSGSVGYFTPDGDFDFNVVIRSIIYDSSSEYLSFHVGSAITYDSDPVYEYNECLLKAETIFESLSN